MGSCKKDNLEPVNSYVENMVQIIKDSGGRYEEAAAVVGHKDIGVTQKHYARIKMNQRSLDAHSNALRDIDF